MSIKMNKSECIKKIVSDEAWAAFAEYFQGRKETTLNEAMEREGEKRLEAIGRYKELRDFKRWMDGVKTDGIVEANDSEAFELEDVTNSDGIHE